MADQDLVVLGTINYWYREKHYRHMQIAANEALRKYANDPVLKFFTAFGMMLEGRVQESMRELDALSTKQDLNLCSILALIHGHRRAKQVDQEAVQNLDSRLKAERKQGNERSYYYAGLFLLHVNKSDKAKEYIDRALKLSPQSKDILSLKGWLEFSDSTDASEKRAQKYFDEAMGLGGAKCLDAMFGKAKCLEKKGAYTEAIDIMNQMVVMITNFLPAIIEKMKLQLALRDWEQMLDTAQRALTIKSSCLQAKCHVILHQLCKEGSYTEASQQIEELLQDFDREEPMNAVLMDSFARTFCRVCGRNSSVLQQTYKLQEKALNVDSANAEYMIELGYELVQQSRVKDAMKCYQNAYRMDDSNVSAVTGIIYCQLLDNRLDDAAGQIEFLDEVKESISKSAEAMFSFLNATLSQKRNESQEKVMAKLSKAVELHMSDIKMMPLSAQYLCKLNPSFLLQIASCYLAYAPQQPLNKGQAPNVALQRGHQILDLLCKMVPGLLESLFQLGKVKFLSGDVDGASSLIQRCLELDPTSSDAHILMAQVHLHGNNFKMANHSLETGLSYNFEVRDHPIYLLIKARILKKQGNLQEAVKLLQTAMTLPGVKGSGKQAAAGPGKKQIEIGSNDRVSLYIELADAHRQLNEQHEAAKVMQDALNDFQGSVEGVRLTIANVDLSLTRGDVEGALSMLRSVTPDQAYFQQAKEKMAEIYLKHRKDKRLYVSCYRELYEKSPNPQTALLLGDAYMNILELDSAVEIYEASLKRNPKDAALASKMGRALVKMHEYGKAISYYEAALRQGGQQFLRHDLAQLLLRMKQYEKAEKVLKMFIQLETKGDLETLVDNAQFLLLLSQVYQQQSRHDERLDSLLKAKEMQDRVLVKAAIEQPDIIVAQKLMASRICSELAQFYLQWRDFDQAINFFKTALSHTENDTKIMLELAKLYMVTNDLDSCQYYCQMVMKDEREKDAATVMIADLLFRKNEFTEAMSHFKQLLQNKPDHFAGLERLIELLRRAGKLEECCQFLEMAEKSSSHANVSAGYNYCKGLYEWYTGNTNEALKYLNKARKDSEYGYMATYNMVEICLNPDNETLGGQVFESGDRDQREVAEKAEGEKAGIDTADRLLKELKPRDGDQKRHTMLSYMILLATKSRTNAEKALAFFVELCNAEKQNIAALYGSAVAHMIMKQPAKARSQLKHVSKATWNIEDAEYLEKSWLLLADICINSGKDDEALPFLKLCLQHNKSCCKAYEYMGYLMEKEQNFKEAAINYEAAWRYGNRNSPAIGYKLAFNYLKAKRYIDAIEVCHQVLGTHPTYPKIRSEILEKARTMIRT